MAETNIDWKEKAAQYASMCTRNDDQIDSLEAEIERLGEAVTRNATEMAMMIQVHRRYTEDARAALELGVTWGLSSKGYDTTTALALAEWITGGFMGDPPKHLLPTSDFDLPSETSGK